MGTNNSNDIAFMPRRLRSTVRGPCILPVFIRSAAVSWRFTTSLARGSEADTAKKDELVVDHQEYSKSGYDGWAAQTTETAFGTERTAPDEQLMHAEIESEKRGLQSNPLEISPAKEELSETRKATRHKGEERIACAGIEKKLSSKGHNYKTMRRKAARPLVRNRDG